MVILDTYEKKEPIYNRVNLQQALHDDTNNQAIEQSAI